MFDNKNSGKSDLGGLTLSEIIAHPNLDSVTGLRYYDDLNLESPDVSETEKLFPPVSSSKEVFIEFPAHTAALMGNVDKLRKLLDSTNFNVFRQDYTNKRTVLHYAAAYGNQDVSLTMINIILSSNYFNKPENLNTKSSLINVQDKIGETALHLAAKYRHRKVAQFLIFLAADVNIKSNAGKESIELIYEYVPQVMTDVFDKAISCGSGEIYEDNFEVELDFGAIVGYPVEEEILKKGEDKSGMETKLLAYALNGSEKKCGEILVHPLVQIFLLLKWKKIRVLFVTSILIHIAWLIIYTVFVLDLYVYMCPYLPNEAAVVDLLIENHTLIRSEKNSSTLEEAIQYYGVECSADLWKFNMVSLISTIFITIIVGLKEIYEMWSLPKMSHYFFNLENIGQILQIILIGITACPVISKGNAETIFLLPLHYQTAAFGVLLAWTLILTQIGQAPQLGIYVEILKKVLKSFGMFMITFISLLAGFAFAFSILMPRSEMFRPHLAFSKVLVMMTGELNYEGLFYNGEENEEMKFVFTGHIIFAAFTIILTIILFNLLIGFTVSDIQGLQDKAHISRLSSQLEQIYLMEKFLFSKNTKRITKLLKLDHRFREQFLVGSSPLPSVSSPVTGRTETDRSLENLFDMPVVTMNGQTDRRDSSDRCLQKDPIISSFHESVSNSRSTVMIPIKKIPKDLVKEVRKLAAMNMNSNTSVTVDETVNTAIAERDELRVKINSIMEQLDQIIQQINNKETK